MLYPTKPLISRTQSGARPFLNFLSCYLLMPHVRYLRYDLSCLVKHSFRFPEELPHGDSQQGHLTSWKIRIPFRTSRPMDNLLHDHSYSRQLAPLDNSLNGHHPPPPSPTTCPLPFASWQLALRHFWPMDNSPNSNSSHGRIATWKVIHAHTLSRRLHC